MSGIDCSLKSLTSPAQGELLQSHNGLTFKLLKTVADFSQALAALHDRFGHELQMLVETFRKRNGELRKERLNCPSGLFQIWELFLQQVEVNSQQHGDISRDLSQSLGQGLIERLFHRKIQSKKVFAHKERIEAILVKSNELLGKCYKDYCQAYAMALTDPAQFLSEYIASHNVYVHQLQATNGMVHAYQTKTLPRLLEELEGCHLDTSASISSSLLSSSELISEKSSEQAAGYQNLAIACRQANHRQDLTQFVKSARQQALHAANAIAATSNHQQAQDNQAAGGAEQQPIRYHQFQAASLQQSSFEQSSIEAKNMQLVPTFKNEIAPDFSQPPDQQKPKLELDRESLEEKIDKFEERIESLTKLLARSHESKLHNKVNELQEELCQRKFDLYVAQIHLSAVRSQLQLFEYNFKPLSSLVAVDGTLAELQAEAQNATAAGGGGGSGPNQIGGVPAGAQSRRSPQSAGAASGQLGLAGAAGASIGAPLGYRSKWIKAFKSLKETPGQQKLSAMQIGAELSDPSSGQHTQSSSASQLENQHHFQEYTFKKIASCDVCKDFLRGHMRQGVKCKLCKISCHNDCQTKAHGTIKCQQPKIKLLRRQKSAGELEVNVNSDENTDPSERATSSKPDSIYSLIRQVLDAKKRGQHTHAAAAPSSSLMASSGNSNNPDDYSHLRPSAFEHSQAMNLSMGNLALANANGKSVSTSALQPGGGQQQQRPESSVDRWSVVMELLAQSRRSAKEAADEAKANADGSTGSSAKRHSKQLDKFKLAARSVGKHGRYQALAMSPISPAPSSQEQMSPTAGPQQQPAPPEAQGSAQYGGASNRGEPASGGQLARPTRATGVTAPTNNPSSMPLEVPPGGQSQQQHAGGQMLSVHHTKSLPVGQLQAGQLHAGQFQPQHPPISLLSATPTRTITNYQTDAGGPVATSSSVAGGQDMALMGHHLGSAISNPIGPAHPQQSGSANHQYQLLDLQQQQLQSISAPHSPQRKRFNLRMKSFSLDSPESPQVAVGSSTIYSQTPNSSLANCNQAAPTAHQHYTSQQQHEHQRHQFQSHLSHAHQHHLQHQHQLYHDQQQQQRQQQQQLEQQNSSYEQMAANPLQASLYYQSSNINGQQAQQHQSQYGGTLRPTRAPGSNQGRHQQQHRHSYHNQMPAASYQHYEGADNLSALASCDSQLAFDGALMAQLAAGRQCASQSSLNIHSSGLGVANLSSSSAPDSKNQLGAGTNSNGHHDQRQQQQQQQQQQRGNSSTGAPSSSGVANKSSGAFQEQHVDGRAKRELASPDYYDQLEHHHHAGRQGHAHEPHPAQQQQPSQPAGATNTFVVLYDYLAQRGDEIQLSAGQLVHLLDTSERDWWKVAALDGTNRIGYFPSSYLAQLYQNERPLQVTQTIQVSNGETCDKLLRGQIVIHTGKQLDNFVTIRSIRPNANPNEELLVNYIQCPEKYLIDI